jgi:hypothetical protein
LYIGDKADKGDKATKGVLMNSENEDKETIYYQDMLLNHLDETSINDVVKLDDFQFEHDGVEYSVDGTIMTIDGNIVDICLTYAGVRTGEDFEEVSVSSVEEILEGNEELLEL